MSDFGRILITIGVACVIVGGIILLATRYLPWLGNLPGDFRSEGENYSFYFPFATMLVISVVGSILLNIILRFFK